MLLLFSLLLLTSEVFSRTPIVLVPGTGGNQLEAKLVGKPSKPAWYCYSTTNSYFTLWLDIISLLPYSINCWVDNMRLEWDMSTMTVKNSPGVISRVSAFGETSSFETVDKTGLVKYMIPFIDHLTTLGYIRGKDIRGSPYDFRYAPDQLPDDFHTNFRKLIETTYASNGNQQVTLISHSYGCPVTLYFLSLQTQDWKTKYLKQWIALSGVFGGTKQQIQLYAGGLLMGVPKAVVNPLTIRGEQRTCTSNLFMLPGQYFWPKSDVVVKTTKRSYTIADTDDLLKDIGFQQGVNMRKHIVNSSSLMFSSPGVPIHCFYGYIPKSTIERLEYNGNFPDSPSQFIMGDGDGTVNSESLKLCAMFAKRQQQEVTVTEVPGVDHNGVFSNKVVLNAINKLLQ